MKKGRLELMEERVEQWASADWDAIVTRYDAYKLLTELFDILRPAPTEGE